MKILPEVEKRVELESLASKRSRGTISTASLSKSSTQASSKASSKPKKRGVSGRKTKKKKHNKHKKKSTRKSSNKSRSTKSAKNRKHSRKNAAEISMQNRSETVWTNPPSEVTSYLENIFHSAFQTFCDHEGNFDDLGLVEIRLCFKNSPKKKKKKAKKGNAKESKKKKNTKKRKKAKRKQQGKKKTKGKRKKSIRQDRDSDDDGNSALPSSFYRKGSGDIDGLIPYSPCDEDGNRKQRVGDVASVDQSSSGTSNETMLINNMATGCAHFGHDGDHIALLAQDTPPLRRKVKIAAPANLPQSPRVSNSEIQDRETTSIRPPERPPESAEDVGEVTKKSKKTRGKRKLNKLIKKTLKKALPSVSGHSKKKKKKKDGKKKKGKSSASRMSKKVKWKQLSDDGVAHAVSNGDVHSSSSDSDWEKDHYLESPGGRKKKPSLATWGVGDEFEPSESSDYGMSTYSGMREAQQVEEPSSSSNNDSMYLEGTEAEVRDQNQDSRSKESVPGFDGEFLFSEEEYVPSSEEEIEEEYYSSEDDGVIYEEESWDEEEEYISPDDEDYVSPEEDAVQHLQDAADYVSPYSPDPSKFVKVGASRNDAEEHLDSRLTSTSHHSYYEEIIGSQSHSQSHSSTGSRSSSSSSSSTSSSSSGSNSSYDSRRRNW